ncbi:transglutaminase domain-containing protein [Anderseniella sp. Alg231-50]|uniref:transglutaminase domain-containing protein n=1 Tax=Anderseniella sp. Alg231-50 TaxID=1922226 RepID=UPI000D5532E1
MSYSQHTAWSDPGPFAGSLNDLPADPGQLANCLENFLIHHAAARSLNFGVPDYAESDRNLRTVERLLQTAMDRDNRPLTEHRKLPAYLYGSCHDFTLIAASKFRSQGIDARLRVGFVDYFRKDRWEDHWLCEYRKDGEWRLLDAQLGMRARQGHGIEFDITDVPRSRFKSGCELWLAIRGGEIDPATCGLFYAGISGHWFPASNVLKDAATLAAIEPLPWDYWGPAREFSRDRAVSEEAQAQLEQLARRFVPAPSSPEEASSMLEDFDWARPTREVLSFADGELRERLLL